MTNYNYYFNIIEDITALEDKLSVKKDFNLEGKVQAVGLRKKVHAIDLPDNTRALAVNNPYTGKVELSVRSRSKDKLEIAVEKIDKALKKVDIEKRRPVEFKYIKLSKTAIRKLRYKHNIHYLRSASYKDGEKVELPTIRESMNKLKARYQLKEVEGSLRGYIPIRAIRQLKGKEVMYEDLAPDNRIRTINKAKTIQREGLAKTAAIILDIKVGDILLGGRFKNVKTKVKKIGKDENNQPTINGKKLLSFRIDKLMPKKDKTAAQLRAYRQLNSTEPMYRNFIPENLIRDREEGLRLQEHHVSDSVKMAAGDIPNKYSKPMTEVDIKNSYGESKRKQLMGDPVHSFRAARGIELIHKEPSSQELERIYANWLLMSKAQKELSEKESLRLFGIGNIANYEGLKKGYLVDKEASAYTVLDKVAISQGLYNRALQSRIAKIITGYGSNPSRVVSKSNVIGNMKKAVTSYRDKALTKSLTGGAFGSGGNYPSVFRNANIRNTAVNSIDGLAQNAINKTPWQLLPRIA